MEALKAIGRIVAYLGMLNFQLSFWLLRMSFIVGILIAAYFAAFKFKFYMLIGLFVVIVGFIFDVWAHRVVNERQTVNTMIETGPFSVVRHPMYSGRALVAIGVALIVRTWPLIIVTLLQVIFLLSVCCAEDDENKLLFGDRYLLYSRRVWLTGIFLGLVRIGIRGISGRSRGSAFKSEWKY